MYTKISDLKENKWADIQNVEVDQLWENEHPSIKQVGLLKDETGIVKFVSWTKSDHPLVQEGATYNIKSMPVSSYNDYLSVAFVKTTKIERVKEDTTVQDTI